MAVSRSTTCILGGKSMLALISWFGGSKHVFVVKLVL